MQWLANHPLVFALGGAAVLLVGSALLGALDLFAVGAVFGFWALIAATGAVLGRPGVDWQIPTDEIRRGSRHAAAEARRGAARIAGRLTRAGGAAAGRAREARRRS